jgi:hypothetical protein
MTGWADEPLPGLGAADVGVPVARICRGRVQACPHCGDPIVFAMTVQEGNLRTLTIIPVVNPAGNVTLGTTIPGNLRADIVGPDRPGDRFAIHHCTAAPHKPTNRRTPNGPTQR